ncbi:SGNH/GDSL hydrolase family protein [Coraliomargarita sp. SDUM461004]|uniref:SGNH/GDSL hydrolase family protein n=1 Tax=Thalassobacterium sedimentorum TaxID=3041258 RepID=A0ABU1AK09_9BACT|nr:SGNH/GDSL hydrolase family protein [Coraliomargarita sp. SDUM461004]MDQ8194508.1 SGNH/GDSL hydrolase family protein [Coraliomargarita sp. SDUM461004]
MKKKFTHKNVFWIGDSIFVHYRPYLVQYLQGVTEIENRNGYRQALVDLDHPRGTNCGDSSMVLSFLKVVLASPDFSTDLIVINSGLHDIKTDPESGKKQIAITDYIQNLRGIVELMREYGYRLVWVSTTPVDDQRHQTFCPEVHRHQSDVLAYNAAAYEIMRHANIPVVDLHGFTASIGEDLYIDHVHYNEKARSLQASYLSGHIERLLLQGEDLEDGLEQCTSRRRIVLLEDSTGG